MSDTGDRAEGGPREWDAEVYDRVGTPMTTRGVELLDRLELHGDETVMDAGCGSGRVTEALLARLPKGRVIALDGSARMLEQATVTLGDDPRVSLVQADLNQPFPYTGLDAIVSTSTLHWVPDHAGVFRRFADALGPGGQLLFECGGEGNIASVVSTLHDQGLDWSPWTYDGDEQTIADLRAAGFIDVRASLVPRPASIPADEIRDYLRTIVLAPYLEGMQPQDAARLISAVAEGLPESGLDYVRLVAQARLA